MKLGSLFDGIGGWQLAAAHTGIVPIWSSEIDPYPAAVTAYHFPKTQQLGDITKIDGTKIAPVDIICAGSPCQNLSQAGNRKGLQGAESSLFYHSIRIIREMRKHTNGKYPRYFVWENVPGAYTSNRGADFKAVLEEIAESSVPMPRGGKWANAGMALLPDRSIAWRTIDAQYWGVPQRRRRIFLVADFAESNRCAAEILFVEQGVSGDSSESQREGQETAENAGTGVDSASGTLTPWDVQSNRIQSVNGTAATLYGGAGQGTHNGAVFIPNKESCLTSRMDGSPCVDRGPQIVDTYDMTHANEVMRPMRNDKVNTLNSRMGTGGNQVPVLQDKEIRRVRRLTPTECERLQGLPDGWTNVEFKGKPASDTRRYKAIGNGMAQPCADYILARIAAVHGREEHKKEEKREADAEISLF